MDFNLEEASWGDEVTTSGKELPLPPNSEEGPDAAGIKKLITYRKNEKNQVEKVVKTYRIQVVQRRVPLAVVERRAQWKKFGQAAATGAAATADKITYHSFEEVRIEKPDEPEKSTLEKIKERVGGDAGGAGGSLVVCRRCGQGHWTLSCPYKDMPVPAGGFVPGTVPSMPTPGAGGAAQGVAGAGAAGMYRPPISRGEAGKGREPEKISEEELTQLKVSNLSEDADEDDLRKLFTPFGRLDKIFLAKDRETGKPRGFAFVRYMRHDDAAAALVNMNSLPFQSLILRVEWSKPAADGGRGGAPGGVAAHHYSGYGKKLAQDIIKVK